MELGQLRHFLAVIQCGSLSEAARMLRMSQGALSISIQTLENSVETPLFERSRRGMILTAFGKTLEARARVIAAEVARAQEDLTVLGKGKTGRVSFGIGASFSNAILPTVVQRFRRTHPQVQLRISEGFYRNLLPQVMTGELEFAIFARSANLYDPDLVTEVLIPRERVVIVTSAQNPIVRRRKITLKDIAAGPWIFPQGRAGSEVWLVDAFRKANLPPPVAGIEIATGRLPTQFIVKNPGFLFTAPELSVRDEIKSGALKIVKVEGPKLVRSLSLFYREDGMLTPAAQGFLSVVRSVCAEIAAQ